MKKTSLFLVAGFLFFILFNLSNVSCLCDDDQINVNSASLEELDKLSGIGPVKAQAIIDSRPFSKLDDLIDVVGIGEVILANIKQQGLACVEDEEEQEDVEEEEETEEDEEEENEEETEEEVKTKKETKVITTNIQESENIVEEEITTIIISPITPKSIKTENNKEQLDKNKFATYGLIMLGMLLFFLLRFKKKENEKSEFK